MSRERDRGGASRGDRGGSDRGSRGGDRGGGGGAERVSLLVRNLPMDMRLEELRQRFEKYGEVRDIYMPRDYYTQ